MEGINQDIKQEDITPIIGDNGVCRSRNNVDYFGKNYPNQCYLYSGEKLSEWRYRYFKEKQASLRSATFIGLKLKLCFMLPIWDLQSSIIRRFNTLARFSK